MNTEIINIRVLEHDLQDSIRIGMSFPKFDDSLVLDKVVENVTEQYAERLSWCGGFDAGCEKYYKRIAIVDADTLEVMRMIYPKETV